MRVTTKGQVTIPQRVRARLGITAGTEVDFVERSDGVVELVAVSGDAAREKVLRRSMDDWLKRVRGTGDSGLSTDQIMAMTRESDDDHAR